VTPKLLLADDSVTIQRVIELTFADEDVEVLAVGDGQQAIDRVRAERPDIVLADVGMPERDGYEVAAFIKGDPQLAHIPVLLLTGAFEPVDEVRARAVGCDGVLVKPFEPQMVISRVRDLLAGNRETPTAPPVVPAPIKIAAADVKAGSAFEAAAGSLEDYFDRLDAALASKNAAAGAIATRLEPMPSPQASAAPEPARIKVSKADDLDLAGWESPKVQEPAPPPAPEAPRVAPSPAPPPAPAPAVDVAPVSEEAALQQSFAALLAAERNAPPSLPQAAAPAVTSDVIDDIVRRVIARMGDESMRAAVLDAAERLVREEIARIKSQG
jgi:CheY-like chemotaxis protein